MVCFHMQHDVADVLSKTWSGVESEERGAPAVCLVVGTTKGVESSNHGNIMSWCVGHGCELIEWEREKTDKPGEDGECIPN